MAIERVRQVSSPDTHPASRLHRSGFRRRICARLRGSVVGMQSLAAAIANEFAEPTYRADLGTIAGARSDDELAAWIGELCRERLGSDVVGARFAGKSVGAV